MSIKKAVTLIEIRNQMGALLKKLTAVNAKQTKLLEKEGRIRTKLNSLEIARQRLLQTEGRHGNPKAQL